MDHNHDMPGMDGGAGQMNDTTAMSMQPHHKMMMHMTFFWGRHAEILFPGWPGTRAHMYGVALVFVFALAFFVEWLSHCRLVRGGSGGSRVAAGLVQTVLYMLRVGLAYMVMLAVMSFNAGVFLVAVAGHTLGFMIFGSRVFKKETTGDHHEKLVPTSDLPPMSC